MKITMIYNTVCAFATQRNATQRNATQRIPQLYLNNNFKFYISQFIFFYKRIQNSCSFLITKKNQKITSFCQKEAKTTPFRIRNSLVKTFSQYLESPSLRGDSRSNPICLDCHDFLRSLAMTIKNKFEIISQLDYGFCYKNYFFNLNQVFRNSYDFGGRFGRNLNYGFGKDYNCNFKNNCDYGFEKNYNCDFGKNYFGNCNFGFDFWNEIYGIGNNLAGFLFNRKTKKNKFMSAHSVGEGEQK